MWLILMGCAGKAPNAAIDSNGAVTLRFVGVTADVEIVVDSDEHSAMVGKAPQHTVKGLTYHHRLEPSQKGFVFRLTRADIDRMEFDGTPVSKEDTAQMLPMLAMARPPFRVDAIGQFVDLDSEVAIPALPGVNRETLAAAAREAWAAVAQGWPGTWTLGEARTEETTLPWLFAPGTLQPATIVRTVLACETPLPCVVLEQRIEMSGMDAPGLPAGVSYVGTEVVRIITNATTLHPVRADTQEHFTMTDPDGHVRYTKTTTRQETWHWTTE